MRLERTVALKENFDTSPEATRQFKVEAKLLSELRHPNLPRVTDYFTLSGKGQYLIMDLIDTKDILQKSICRRYVIMVYPLFIVAPSGPGNW